MVWPPNAFHSASANRRMLPLTSAGSTGGRAGGWTPAQVALDPGAAGRRPRRRLDSGAGRQDRGEQCHQAESPPPCIHDFPPDARSPTLQRGETVMKLRILAVGRARSGPEAALIAEYQKRLHWPLAIEEVEEKRPLSGAELKAREGALLQAAIERGAAKGGGRPVG